MKGLAALIEISNNTRLEKYVSGQKSIALIKGIKSGRIRSAEDAKQVLFKDNLHPGKSLYALVERVKQQVLLGLVFSIKPGSEYRTIESKVYAGYSAAMILCGAGNLTEGINEAKKVLKLSTEYEFLNISNELSLLLSRYFTEVKKRPKKRKYYIAQANHYSKLIAIATLCETFYTQSISALAGRSSYTPSIIRLLENGIREMEGLSHTSNTAFQYYSLKVIYCFAIQDYAKGALISQDALAFFYNKRAVKQSYVTRFLLYRGVAAIAARQYERASSSFLEALVLSDVSQYNKQIITYYQAINALHAGYYFKAQHHRDQAQTTQLNPVLTEYWGIISAYLYFFNGGRKFKLGKFFNETVEASKDKEGQNINILICDLIISITDKRDRFLHRIEAVQNYVYRHLKGKPTERARIFLDMVFQIPRHDFNPRRIKQNTYRKRAQLKRRSVYANHNLEIEIVLFEAIWERILDRLERKETIRAIG